MGTLNVIVLVLLVVQSLIGVTALLRWRAALRNGSPFPTAVVATHIAIADAGTVLWIIRLVTDDLKWGWAALVVILVGNAVGDIVLAGRWRLDQALSGQWLTGWVSAAKGLLNPKRRLGAAHAAGAGITTTLLAIACIVG